MSRQNKPKRYKTRASVGALGKALTRRSRGRCELCASKDAPQPYEVWPLTKIPDMDHTLLACLRCRGWLDKGAIIPVEAHFLSRAVWSEVLAVRLASTQLLKCADFDDTPWVQDALANLVLDEESGPLVE